MPCRCREHNPENPDIPHFHDGKIYPEEQCPLCAEKHLSTAAQLYEEHGYADVNRQKIVGELVNAAWHLVLDHPDLADRIRDARHVVQIEEEPPDWHALLSAIDPLAREAARAIREARNKPPEGRGSP